MLLTTATMPETLSSQSSQKAVFNSGFYPRGRNVNGFFLDRLTPDGTPICLLVSYWGRLPDGTVGQVFKEPTSKNWGTSPPAFLRYDDSPRPAQEICVGHVLNLQPGRDDFWSEEEEERFPSRIRVWKRALEVLPVVVDERTGLPIDTPDWFQSTLAAVQRYYFDELGKLKKLVGDDFDRRVAEVDHPLIRNQAVLVA